MILRNFPLTIWTDSILCMSDLKIFGFTLHFGPQFRTTTFTKNISTPIPMESITGGPTLEARLSFKSIPRIMHPPMVARGVKTINVRMSHHLNGGGFRVIALSAVSTRCRQYPQFGQNRAPSGIDFWQLGQTVSVWRLRLLIFGISVLCLRWQSASRFPPLSQ